MFCIRRYTHNEAERKYTNTRLSDLAVVAAAGGNEAAVHAVCMDSVEKRGELAQCLYCIYPAAREHTFFERVPFWIFCDATHVGHAQHVDVYPYFQVPDGTRWVYVVLAASVESARETLKGLETP